MKKINIDLDTRSIANAVKQLERYSSSLEARSRLFAEKLTQLGIKTANSHITATDDHGENVVLFYSEIETTPDGCTAIMFGKDVGTLTKTWLTMDKDANGKPTGVLYARSEEVSAILMYEFGSGFNAVPGKDKPGLNYPGIASSPQGTFPNQTHAFDSGGWNWRDMEGYWHHSDGIVPTQPMYHAWEEMHKNIKKIAKECFKEG